jgi:hypothetical protein
MNDSDGEENFLLDELRVKRESIFMARPSISNDFDNSLKFDPS